MGLKLSIPKAFMTTFFSVLYQFLLRFSRTHNARVDTQILEYNDFFEGYIVRTSQFNRRNLHLMILYSYIDTLYAFRFILRDFHGSVCVLRDVCDFVHGPD